METNHIQNSVSSKSEEQEIDLLALIARVWAGRNLIFKCCGIAVLVALVVAFSIPKEYTATITLAPEFSKGSSSLSSLSSLASIAGINLQNNNTRDAINPNFYPDIVSSVGFSTSLFSVPLRRMNDSLQVTLYEYLKDYQRVPWWRTVTGFPFKCLGWTLSLFREEKVDTISASTVNPFHLTREEAGIVGALGQRIDVSVDKKTYMITLSVTMQDPLIAATLTDTVMVRLQQYVTDYRTGKARGDLEFAQQLYDEARQKYYDAQQAYADFVDMNQNLSLRSVQTRQERLQDEMNLAYNLYNQTAQQLQLAKAKVQESTPAYAVVQEATVPLRASKPSKPMILIGFVFLAGVGSVGWILFGRDLLVGFRKKKEEGD